jgi:beta-lactamase regulating signal transducer with metallopeptidase domain
METIVGVLNKAGAILIQHGLTMLLQFGLLTSLLFLADRAIRWHVKASLRYCLWCLLLVKLVLPATFSLPTGISHLLGVNFSVKLPQIIQPAAQIHALVRPDRDFTRYTDGLNTSQFVANGDVAKAGNFPMFASGQYQHITLNWNGCVFAAWFLGVLVFSAIFIRRLASVRTLVTQSEPAPARLVDLLRICREKVGVRGNVELRLSSRMTSPAVCGLSRPVIVIPTDLLEKTNHSKLAVIFIHELSHIKRADMWVNLFQTTLQIFYFYNPFLWLTNACVRRVREQAVDEMVLTRLNGAVTSYSSMLIDVAEKAFLRPRFSLATAGIIESKNKLKERIKIMLNKPLPKNTNIGFTGLVILLIAAAVMLPMAKAKNAIAPVEETLRLNAHPIKTCNADHDAVHMHNAKFETTRELVAPFANGSTLVANTKVGNITVTGSTEAQCKVIATIRVDKGTTEQAEQLANMVKVNLEKENDNLVVVIDLPEGHKEQGISVDLDITVEENAGLQLKTAVGNISISNIAGAIDCQTNVGRVDCEGAINSVDIKADVGDVSLSYADDAPSACNAQIETNVGNVVFKGPAQMSATITAEAKLGSIRTDLPLKVQVEKLSQKVEGAIGDSAGEVIVKSNVGSITLNSGQ